MEKKVLRYDSKIWSHNCGGFYDDGKISKDTPRGYIIENGKIIYQSHNQKSYLIGMSQ